MTGVLTCALPIYLLGWEEIIKCQKEATEVKEFVNVSSLALTVARKFDQASLKEKNMVLMALDLELIKEEPKNISSVS